MSFLKSQKLVYYNISKQTQLACWGRNDTSVAVALLLLLLLLLFTYLGVLVYLRRIIWLYQSDTEHKSPQDQVWKTETKYYSPFLKMEKVLVTKEVHLLICWLATLGRIKTCGPFLWPPKSSKITYPEFGQKLMIIARLILKKSTVVFVLLKVLRSD